MQTEGENDQKLSTALGARRRKMKEVEEVVQNEPSDLDALKEMCISENGLMRDAVRRKVWPKLLGIETNDETKKPSMLEIQNHKDYTQVVMDVNRSIRRFPPGIEEMRRLAMQDELTILIVRILMKHPQLHYYQGYHDICITFLLVVGPEQGFSIVEKLSITYLKDFMAPTMNPTIKTLSLIYPILGHFNPKLKEHIKKSEVETIFCLSWIITWFGHVLNDYHRIVRLYDFFLASHPLMPIYLAASIILYREEDIFATEVDMAMMHHTLSHLPDHLPFELLIKKSNKLFAEFPPERALKILNTISWKQRLILCRKEFPVLNRKNARQLLRISMWTLVTAVPVVIAYYAFKQ